MDTMLINTTFIDTVVSVTIGFTDSFSENEYVSTVADSLFDNNTGDAPPGRGGGPAAKPETIILLSVLFCTIGFIGIFGNFLVIYIILTDRTMRHSVTNLFILNLAWADFIIMVGGVPEIAQFMANKGWVMGALMCRLHRYVLVVSLYVAVMSLLAVCVERYIAIMHPIQAHLLCSRRRILAAICVIWPIGFLLGLPIVLFNRLGRPSPDFPFDLCRLIFPGDSGQRFSYLQRSLECLLFFVGPVVVQTVLYTFICRRLFSSTKELHRKQVVLGEDGARRERDSDAIKARKGVVKMLIASVVVYFLSYAPSQFSGIYRMVAPAAKTSWSFHVLTMTLAYINSACNPVLYVIFSQNFRVKFRQIFCHCLNRKNRHYERASPAESFTYRSNPASTTRLTAAVRNTSCNL